MNPPRFSPSLPRFIVRVALSLGTLLGLGLTSAAAQRVAIVYSESSAAKYYDRFTYNQLFAAVQNQARMAGIPYDLLSEDDLTDINKLLGHEALIIPFMPHVKAAKLAAIEAALDLAVSTHHIGLIAGGDLMTMSETGAALTNPMARLSRWFGLAPGNAANGVATTLLATTITHPAMRDYTANETIVSWPKLWFGSYVPVAGQTATLLATLKGGTTNYNGVLATQTGGRNVHFANEEVLGSTNLLWSCLQWVVFGDQTPIRLNMGRMKSLFVSRNDMDQSKFIDEVALTDVPLYNLLATWKSNYNFVGSFYINIGNNVAAGETTNWAISGPLYRNYIALGNEIGTHSWTHPESTSTLNATQLEFEFNQSKNTIGAQLGITVAGAAIPGVAESISVQQQLDNYFSYLSGRYGALNNGFPGGIGRLTPSAKSIYWSLTMEPDFTLIEDQKKTPAQAQAIWANQMAATAKHASLPIMHWLWHDYAPTISANLYTVSLISNTIATAKSAGAEFVTLADVTQRIRSFEGSTLSVTGTNPITATVTAQGVGQFSLRPPSNQPISHVTDWYAYDNTQVFLPDTGGTFSIQLGATPSNVSRITELPMRARLLSVTGDGNALAFSFNGEGTVKVIMSPALTNALTVTGADSFTANGNVLSLVFASGGVHNVTLSAGSVVNQPPVAANQSATTQQSTPVALTVSATDPNSDTLTYTIVTGPTSGQLSGTAPSLTYTPNATFTGIDSFTFRANDGKADSNLATASITVTAALQMTFTSTASEDGWVLESTETSNGGGFINSRSASGQALRLGDDDINRQYKSILSFNTSALPDKASILSMRLELTRGSTTGTDALTTHGAAKVDIKAGAFNNSATLQTNDFQAAADATAVATFTSQGDIGSVYVIPLGTPALSKVSLTSTTQLRLSLTLDDNNDTEATYVGFHSGGSAANLAPRLIVTYR